MSISPNPLNPSLMVYRVWAYNGRTTPMIPGHGPEFIRDGLLKFTVKAFDADEATDYVLAVSGRKHAEIRKVRKARWFE